MGGSILGLLRNKKHFSAHQTNRFIYIAFCLLPSAFCLLTFYAPVSVAQTTPVTSGTRPILRTGSQGTAVSELQGVLKLLGYYTGTVDGVYGETTAQAVTKFQTAAGITADGIVGPATWEKLFPQTSTASNNTASEPDAPSQPTSNPTAANTAQPAISNLPILRLGTRGPAVFWLQTRLRVGGFFRGTVDGVFGADTETAVQAAQQKNKIDPDGIVGPATWRVLLP